MATRTYCDHCGNTVRNPKVLSFGDVRDAQNAEAMSRAQAGVGGIASLIAQPNAQRNQNTSQSTEVIDVDLCPTCVPIWMERVKKLCEASDEKEN